MPDFKGLVVTSPKYFKPVTFYFASVYDQEFLDFVCIVSFSLSVYFYVAGVYRGSYFAVPVDIIVL